MKHPRPFTHTPIYTDPRRERLAAIEQRARRELGLDTPEAFSPEQLRGVFSRGQRHVRRREGRIGLSTQKLVFLIVLLLLVWKLLL